MAVKPMAVPAATLPTVAIFGRPVRWAGLVGPVGQNYMSSVEAGAAAVARRAVLPVQPPSFRNRCTGLPFCSGGCDRRSAIWALKSSNT